MDNVRSLSFGGLAALLLLFACAEALPLPELGPHVEEEPLVVPYPPPAARPEIVPDKHGKSEVWVDGQWLWRGRRWVWQAGGFVVPPKDSYYAPAITLRQQDGSLAHFEGGFRPRRKDSKREGDKAQ